MQQLENQKMETSENSENLGSIEFVPEGRNEEWRGSCGGDTGHHRGTCRH